jgi:Carboxypeptidase regulatory-like domain
MSFKNKAAFVARILAVAVLAVTFAGATRAQSGAGSISGTIQDPTGAVIPGVTVTLTNVATGVSQTTQGSESGSYAFPIIPVGQYSIEVSQAGFKPYKRTGLTIDVNTKLQADISLELGEENQEVTVEANTVQIETQSTQMGDVVNGPVMTAVALNGRSFTDLLALQPGIVPMSTQTNDSVVMAGVTVAIPPSGNLNPGNQSISGQREDANGFLVNGSDVKEEMNGGTSIIPNLDAIDEFRVLTNSFDPEYGNYAGGIVTVVTKGGTDSLHGDAFEFLRNTLLDSKNYFSPERETYQQNQFGGTIGGPIKKQKLFFFGDYQGTRTIEGVDTGLITVPSLANRAGNLSDMASSFSSGGVPFTVAGAGLAAQLQNSLGYPVSQGEPYYKPGCSSSTQCVFPNAIFPVTAWAAPAQQLLKYIPLPNDGPTTFAGEESERVRDDKLGFRLDQNTARWGNFSEYYFFDDYKLTNPFPSGQGGATVPGFSGLNFGRSQLISVSNTKTFSATTVNEAHFSVMRSANVVGQPQGGLGPSYQSQGFVVGAGTAGIYPLDPAITGIENVVFQGQFVMGLPITDVNQTNTTELASDSLSKVIRNHTLKFGAQLSFEQVNVNPNAIFNGTFIFDGYQTGSNFTDFLVGAPNQFNQQDSQHYYPRHRYAGWYGEDSWRVKSNLTFNYGLRMELMRYWSEKYNQVPTFIPGEQSLVYPNAFPGLVYVTDPHVPTTLVPQKIRYSPRIGVAYSPNSSNGFLGKVFGGPGETSIRASYGVFTSVIEGNSIGVDEPQPPYGLSDTVYNGLFSTPYNLADGTPGITPYPLTFPPLNATRRHPNPGVTFVGVYNPQSGMTAPVPGDTYPYTENYFLSIERQLPGQNVLSFAYVGSQAHHLPLVYSANPGNPALCLALNQPGVLVPGESCGPGGENNTYNLAETFAFGGITYPAGTALQGTRSGLNPTLVNDAVPGNYFGNDDYQGTIGNSSYNALQVSLKGVSKRLTYTLGYTYSKSLDQASSLSDVVDPFNFNLTRGLSAWNMTHNFVATYDYRLPLERLTSHAHSLLNGWEIAGITRVSTGFPITLSTDGDNSLQGSSPNGVNNRYLDMPDRTGQPLDISSDPRANGLVYFNPAAFTTNALGTPGDAGRRSFSGPGAFNTDLALLRNFKIREQKTLQFRLETFNTFNHVQFFGPQAVSGDVDNPLFGHVINAQPPRLIQVALKFMF